MKRSFLIIAILVVTLLSACKKHYDDYQITGIVMQRIEIDDSNMKENNLYLLEPIVEYNYSYEFILNQSAGPMGGSVDKIDTVYVTSALDRNMNQYLMAANTYKNETIKELWLYHAEDSINWIRIRYHGGMEGIRYWLQNGERVFFQKTLLSISKSLPMPENIVIRFADRSIRAKVNNEPKRYKVKDIILEQQYDE